MWFTSSRRLIRKLLLAALTLGATPTALAADSYQINSTIDFGRIMNESGSNCHLSATTTALSGSACIDSLGTIGDIDITVTPNQSYTITVFPPGAQVNQISFQPALENGGNSDTVNVDASGTFNLRIGGTLTIGGAAPIAGSPTSFSYTIQVISN
ncbi:hypothetical protein [Marinobacterium arenosum]|uniref:hypothetical protein n=1 Tax=Marinobacterium arenosum TaxID=2862496 RepID=UPI001C94ADBC|nr:hypothetical protein [Marinobacterium arenosum]MBY4676498.1 hypothetical protein [Marinobacterium arenosum]